MKPVLRDFAMLWRAGLTIRPGRVHLVLAGLTLLAMLVFGLLAWVKTSDPFEVLANCLRAAFAVPAIGYLGYFVPTAVRLNTPANAALVPRMRRRLIQLTALAWLVTAAVSALLAAGTTLPMRWPFLFVGFWLIAVGLIASGHRAGMVLLFGFPMLSVFNRAIPDAWLALLATTPGLVVATLLLLAVAAWTLETMFPPGGDRHFKLRAAQKRALERRTMGGQARQPGIQEMARSVYNVVLRRASARRDSGALMMHVLGPVAHPMQLAVQVPLILAGAAVVMFLLRHQANADILEAVAQGSWTGVSWAQLLLLFYQERRLARLDTTRGEQSLVKLAPALPGGAAAFNRLFNRRLLGAVMGEWIAISALMLGILVITGASADIFWRQLCFCCLSLPVLASALRDHARRSVSAISSGVRLFLGLAASTAVSFAAAFVASRVLGTPLLPTAALVSVLLAVLATGWRWRALADAPHAFPVGRLA
ncbi:hypothetical protein [Massilia sp. Leaf139]|uniref:hypothetical protein n=1 Tax=Massilia sp. Leaf139 TaxID=1736272 RepID=UPI0006FE363B|nr:hypothetical protein [Massilia sp. Leaf139]KQQ91825.1 hypothetical protein ASF77_07800 [Massilia sp. Leaf139]